MKNILSYLSNFFRSRFFWINLLLFALVCFLLAFFAHSYMTNYTRHGESVFVPDLRGQTVDQVSAFLQDKNLNYLVFDSTYVVGKSPMEVLEQDPLPGFKVKQDRRIYLTVNAKDAPEVKMPNLIDASLKDARLQLENKGLSLGKIIYRPHIWNVVMEIRHEGDIIEGGHTLTKGSTIDLVVGDGKGINTFTMGSFVGLSYEDAAAAIHLSNLRIGEVNRDKLLGSSKGFVYAQEPKAGSKVTKGERINLWLVPVLKDIPGDDN